MSDACLIVDPLAVADWDRRVADVPGCGVFHSAGWAGVLRDAYGYKPCYAVRFCDGGAVAWLAPFMHVTSSLTCHRGVSLPFTDCCSLIADDAEDVGRLVAAVLSRGQQRRWRYAEFRCGAAPVRDAPASQRFVEHTINLSGGAHVLFDRVDRTVRAAIRRAEEAGLVVSVSTALPAMRVFYVLHCRTRRRHGLPPPPWRFFAHLHRHLVEPERGVVVTALLGERPVAAGVFLHAGDEAMFKYSASDERYLLSRPNNLVLWEAMRWHASCGFARMNLGRTEPVNAGLRRFKVGFGAVERELDYYRYDFGARAFVERGGRSVRGWHTLVFRRMPLSVLRVIGAVIYPHTG